MYYICSRKLLKDMKNKSILLAGVILAGLAACEKEPHFTITGTIEGAADKMLYLEASGITAITPVDSVELGSSGTFTLEGKQPQYPEFYRLRIDDNIINLAVDSTETIHVEARLDDMSTGYTVEGETNLKIKELAVKQIQLQADINRVYASRTLAPYQKEDSVEGMVSRYKEDAKMNYIFKAPNTLYAYFALFQRVNGASLFDPLHDAADVRCFGAVATSFDNLYPHSTRTTNLHNLAVKGMKNTRTPRQKEIALPADKVSEAGLIDIAIKDQNGRERRLSDLKGKVVLLDFTVYGAKESPARNMTLRGLYDTYKGQGLEIYQIALDENEHYWKTSADNLPWICVRDGAGAYSNYLRLYNVTRVPTYFLINRANELKARQENIQDLEAEVKKLIE